MSKIIPNIIVTDLSKIYTYKHKTQEGYLWAYMGKNVCKREKIASVFGDDNRYLYADEIKDISYQCKQKFLDWVAVIEKDYSKPIFWWITRLASKSTLQTDFYLLFCYLELLRKWCSQNKELIVFIEDAFLLQAAKDNLRSFEIFFDTSKHFYIKQYAFLKIRSYFIRCYFLLIYLIYYVVNRIFNWKYKKKVLHKTDILIRTWLERRSFEDAKSFSDSFFGNLYTLYNKNGYNTATLSQLNLDIQLLKKAYQFNNIVPLPCYMSFSAILKILFLHIPLYNNNQLPLDSFDLTHLLEGEKLKEKASPAMRAYCLEHQAYKRFFESIEDTKLRAIIYPFENHPWEKIMLLALKEAGVFLTTAGYQHSSIPELLLIYDLGKDEIDNIPLPSVIITNAAHNEQRLRRVGFPCVCNGGNLRYRQQKFTLRVTGISILLLCSIDIEHTLALIVYGIKRLLSNSKNILIKLHPDISKNKITRYLKSIPSEVRFVDGKLADLYNKFDVVIHTGTTAAVECLAIGKKVYKLKTELLDIDPLDSLVSQNEIDENARLDLSDYTAYSLKTDILYEDIQISTWLDVVHNREK